MVDGYTQAGQQDAHDTTLPVVAAPGRPGHLEPLALPSRLPARGGHPVQRLRVSNKGGQRRSGQDHRRQDHWYVHETHPMAEGDV